MYAYCAWHVLLSCSRTTEIQAVHGDVQAVKGGPVHELLEKVPGAPARHPIIYCSEGGGEEKERERDDKKSWSTTAHTQGEMLWFFWLLDAQLARLRWLTSGPEVPARDKREKLWAPRHFCFSQ